MPAETRQIIFTHMEVLRAIKNYRQRRRDPLPTGTVSNFTIRDAPEVQAILSITPDTSSIANEYVFKGSELAAALVMFCIEKKIPLPATNAKKTLKTFDKSIGLEVVIDQGN